MRKNPFSYIRKLAIFTTLIAIIGIVHPGESQMRKTQTSSRSAAGTASFGLSLFTRLHQAAPAENIFISPASIGWCLTMALNGAEGATRQEILSALHASGQSVTDLNNAYRDWKQSWTSIDSDVEIDVANSIWSRKGLTIRPEFIHLNRSFFDSQAAELDFNDPESASRINDWVKDKTRGKIEKIVDQISADSVLFLINAIYFNGKWTHEFNSARTKNDSFKTPSGARSVPMMRQNGTYQYQERPEFQAVSLPYGKGRLSMHIFLPSGSSSLQKLIASLNSLNWQQWMAEFSEADGEIALPRFNVRYDVTLNQYLKSLGIRAAFDPGLADFGGMIQGQGRAFISSVKHKALAEVTEKGTVATAATSTEMQIVSMRVPTKTFRMIVNRPFLFVIQDNQMGIPLFIGAISNPH